MAKSARSRENKTVWTGLAERWIRFARLYDSKNAMLHASGSARRHRTPVHGSAH
ncbi:MAG TPA: hypothetical protein VGL31_21490 [Xanthobacteraceae bacterium]